MTTKIWSGRSLTLCLTLAFLAGGAQLVLPSAHAQEPVGQLTVTGKVKVNGQPAATGDIVASGSGVETAKGSSAVVSLGKLGRVEALPETRMKLSFSRPAAGDEEMRPEMSISIVLEAGSVVVTTGPGVSATITRKDD